MAKKKTTDETTPAAASAEETAKKPAARKKAAPKTDAAAAPAAEATAAAKAAAPKKSAPAKTPAKPAAAGFGFGIDTNLAAQAAAKMLLNRPATSSSAGGSTVKNLKDSLSKSTPNLGNLLGGNTGPAGKSSNLPHFTNQQKGHNQSTGHVGNTGVPRRTPG